MHKHRSFALLILLCTLVVGGMLPRPIHAQSVTSCTDFSLKNNVIVLNIVIPGLKTTECTKSDGVPRTYAYVDGFGTYLVTFYTWFAGAAGTLAVFMAMFAGFQWLTAAGNSGRIGQAKETLTGAIVGLVLLLGSYVLLNTISPTFVNLTGPNVNSVERLGLGCYGGTPAKQCADVAGGATSCLPLINSICTVGVSTCGCSVICAADEVLVDYARCKALADDSKVPRGDYPGDPLATDPDLTISPGNNKIIAYPFTLQTLLSAFKQDTGTAVTSYAELNSWLSVRATANPTDCFIRVPNGCLSNVVVYGVFSLSIIDIKQPNSLVVQDYHACCQKRADSLSCTIRTPIGSWPKTQIGRCG